MVERLVGRHGELAWQDDRSLVFTTEYADVRRLARWILELDGKAGPGRARRARRARGQRARARGRRARGAGAGLRHARSRRPPSSREPAPRGESPVLPERFAVLQALLAQLLAACGDEPRGTIDAELLKHALQPQRRGPRRPPPAAQPRQLRRRLLRALRRAARGRTHDRRREGAVRRGVPPAGAPLAARGEGAAARARPGRPARRGRRPHHARRRAREGRGGVRRLRDARGAVPRRPRSARTCCRCSTTRSASGALVRLEYLSREGDSVTERLVEPHSLQRRARRVVLRHVRPAARRRAHVPRRPHPQRAARSTSASRAAS